MQVSPCHSRYRRGSRFAYWAKSARVRRKRLRRLLLMAVLSGARFAQAQVESTSSIARSQMDSIATSRKETVWAGAALFESFQYPTVLPGQENLSQNHMMEASLVGKPSFESWRNLTADVDLSAGRSLNLNSSYLAVSELSASWNLPKAQTVVTLGRHRRSWNSVDEDWNLGLWQPTFGVDTLRIEQQGLTGLFADYQDEWVQATGFYSPLFIPSTTPEIANRNGEITSESRWFRSIPTRSQVMGRSTPLFFRLEVPDIQSLIRQSGWGAQIRVGARSSSVGPWVRLAYADKAMNSLFFKYDASLRTRGTQGSRGEVELRPLAHRHQIWGSDAGYTYATGEVVVSLTQETPQLSSVVNEPNREGLATDFVQQAPRPVRAAMFRWDQDVTGLGLRTPVRVRLSYLKAENDLTRDVDRNGFTQSALLPYRLLYTQAVALEGRFPLSARWSGRFKYLRELDQKGSVWNAEVEYRSRSNWGVVLGGDVLGPDDVSDANTDGRFINYFRQNDRVYGGLSYVF